MTVRYVCNFHFMCLSNVYSLASRCNCRGKLPEIFRFSREFEVPEGIIDLIEIQIIFW